MSSIKERLRAGEIPAEALGSIAAMTFPLPVEELLDIFPLVHERGDEGVQAAVVASFSQLVPDTVSDFLRHVEDPSTLGFYFDLSSRGVVSHGDVYLMDIVKNGACPVGILKRAASLPVAILTEFMINNHQLLQKHHELLDELKANETLSAAQKRRLEEYSDYGLLEDRKLTVGAWAEEGLASEEADEAEVPPADAVDTVVDPAVAELLASEDPTVLNQTSGIEMEADMDLNTYQKLLKLKVAEKIQCALKGDKEMRSILIRDSNRTVALSVIESPKLTEPEVEMISALRNVHRDVLRAIGKNRKFLKKYKIVANLVKNPKVPQDISMTLLNRMTDRDLQFMVKDRTLSEFLRRSAKRILQSRKKH